MARHLDAALLRHRHNGLEEVGEMLPQFLFTDPGIFGEQAFQFLGLVAGVPAGQRNALADIDLVHFLSREGERGGTVRQHLGQRGAGPVEYRHEIVADDLDADLAQVADVLLEIGDQRIAARLAQLDVLMHRNGLDHLQHKPMRLDLGLQSQNAFHRPDLPHRHVINGRDDAMHAGNLADVLQGDGIAVAIPAEGHFHLGALHLCLLLCTGLRNGPIATSRAGRTPLIIRACEERAAAAKPRKSWFPANPYRFPTLYPAKSLLPQENPLAIAGTLPQYDHCTHLFGGTEGNGADHYLSTWR